MRGCVSIWVGLLLASALPEGCGPAASYEDAKAIFVGNRTIFEDVNRRIAQCGLDVFHVDSDNPANEDCQSGSGEKERINEVLRKLNIKYVAVDKRNLTGAEQITQVRYILSRDRMGRGGDAQSIIWADPDSLKGPDYRDVRIRPLSNGMTDGYFEEIGTLSD